jgi:hypothetical protein
MNAPFPPNGIVVMRTLVATMAAASVMFHVACLPKSADVRESRNQCPTRNGGSNYELGTNPDPESALRPTEIVLSTRGAGLLTGSRLQTTTWAAAGDAAVRYSRRAHTVALGSGAAALHLGPTAEPSWDGSLGNLLFQYGMRWFRWSEDQEDGTSPPHLRRHTYRRALALRLSADIDTGNDGRDGANQRALGTVFSGQASRHAPGHHVRAIAEARYEMVGCFAPFVHVQGGAGTSMGGSAVLGDDTPGAEADGWDTARTTLVFPASVVVGAHADVANEIVDTSPVTLYGQYSLVVGRLPTLEAMDDGDPLVVTPDTPLSGLSRIRFGAEWSRVVRFGVNFDVQLGKVEGVFMGATVSFPLGIE